MVKTKSYECICGKEFKTAKALAKHQEGCFEHGGEELLKDKDFRELLIDIGKM